MNEDLLKIKALLEDLAGMFGTFPNPAVAFVGLTKEKEAKREKALVDGKSTKK